jgi:hypothetical protein
MKTILMLVLSTAAACKLAPPAPPFLSTPELAVVVVRPSQDMALRLAQFCEPVAALTSPTDAHLRQQAHAKGANTAEVLYDGAGSTAVLHTCPPGFDAHAGAFETSDAAARGTATSTTTQSVTVH